MKDLTKEKRINWETEK